jgi:adenine-specific DNA-methyltransferase
VLARKIGSSLGALDVETAAHQVGLAYIGMLPRAHRAAHGVYYTPPLLGARLIDRATNAGVDWVTARVLDPACGGGAFLAPVARRILDALGDCEPRILLQNVAQRLRGYEIDPFAAWLSQVALDAVLLPVTRACGRRLPCLVTVCDALRSAPPDDPFDLVIGNPPYARVRLDAGERRRFERSLFGHANLYGLFTDAALRHTKPGGVVAYVTPTSFLAGEYSKNLRALLRREAPPFSIDFVAARDGVFDGVLQETLLATYRRGARVGRVQVHEIAVTNESAFSFAAAGRVVLGTDPSGPWILPRNRGQATLVARLAAMPHRLSDWGYTVNTGPLVWNRYKNQLAKRPARDRYPIVWAEAVTPDGRFAWRADKRDHVPYCEIRPGDEWMMVRNACVLLQRTTSKEQQRRLIAAPLPEEFVARHGAVIVENHLNMIRAVGTNPPVSHVVLAAFLNSAAADRAFRCVSGSVAVSAYELESLPLPPPGDLETLSRLVVSRATRAAMDAACDRLYGKL